MRLAHIKNEIDLARYAAIKQAKADAPGMYLKSRGTFLATGNKSGQCHPCPEAEAHSWNRTLREITGLVERVKRDYPECDEVYIAGGYDAYESVRDAMEGNDNYEPWISAWTVTVWRRA